MFSTEAGSRFRWCLAHVDNTGLVPCALRIVLFLAAARLFLLQQELPCEGVRSGDGGEGPHGLVGRFTCVFADTLTFGEILCRHNPITAFLADKSHGEVNLRCP